MNVPFPTIPESTSKGIYHEWFRIIRNRECGTIIFPPKGGAQYRIQHMMLWDSFLDQECARLDTTIELVTFSVFQLGSSYGVEDVRDMLMRLIPSSTPNSAEVLAAFNPYDRKQRVLSHGFVFLITDTDAWYTEGRKDIFEYLSSIHRKYTSLSFLLFCETDISDPDIINTGIQRNSLSTNTIFQSLYTSTDYLSYIQECEQYYGVSLSSEKRSRLLSVVGRHQWLLREAIRLYQQGIQISEEYLTYPTMLMRCDSLWSQLTPKQQAVCLDIATGVNDVDTSNHSRKYLIQIGMIERNNGVDELTIPLFAEYIRHRQRSEIDVLDGRIMIYGQERTKAFSKTELIILVYFHTHRTALVSRPEIASIIWGQGKNAYSDYALDRHMSRLREKIRLAGVRQEIIHTVKKQGYIWRQ